MGGSYVRLPDGGLTRTEWTEREPPAEAQKPAKPAKPKKDA
jgi:hypothetical protein